MLDVDFGEKQKEIMIGVTYSDIGWQRELHVDEHTDIVL